MPNYLWVLLIATVLLLQAQSSPLPAASNAAARPGVPYIIDVWETEHGLPQNSVITLTQTRDGYLWMGTLEGLARFDGIRFTVFDENNTPGLGSSRIVSLFEDSRSNLWIGTENAGVALLKDGRVTKLGIGQSNREGRLAAICEDTAGAIWLYTADGQLWRDWNGVTNRCTFGTDRFSVDGSTQRRAVIAEKAGLVWVGTEGRLAAVRAAGPFEAGGPAWETNARVGKLDFLLASERGGHWRLADGRVQKWTTNYLEHEWIGYPWANATVSAACEDRQGNLVVGTLGAGLFWYDAQGKATALSTNEGLSYNYVLSLQVDREGSLWVGTDGGGLNRVKRNDFGVLEETRGLVVRSVSETQEGGLWIGYNVIEANAKGASLWKEGAMQWFGPSQGLLNSSIGAVFVDSKGAVWAGTSIGLFQWQGGRFHVVTGPPVIHRAVQVIYEDRRHNLWLGTQSGLARWDGQEWTTFTKADGLSADVVRAIADDVDGNVWIGTERGGLNRWRDGKFTVYRKKDGLPSDDISSLYLDGDGVLWIGTSGGLARWHSGQWTVYTTHEGLVRDNVGYIVEDEQGYLWIGSNAGLMRAPKKALNDFARNPTNTISFRVYGKEDGLPSGGSISGFQPGACRARDGKLWFPTIKGLASVNVAELQPNRVPPPVVIESMSIDGSSVTTNGPRVGLPQVVTVPAGREQLEFQYTSLNLAAAEMTRFKYRLEGHETAWFQAPGATRVAHYGRMPPPGHYRFQVTACNEDGVWNEAGASVAIIIEPPFWQTWWFLTLSTAFVLGWVVAGVHYVSTQKLLRQLESLRQQEALEKERSRIARDIHDQLGASLTQVSLLGELVEGDKDSPAEVEAHGRQISQTARDTARALDQIVWTVNPSNDTLEGLVNYVCKYAQEYLAVAGLRYRLDVPPQLPDAVISPEVRHNVFLASKEAVTNVVRHAQASSVWLRLKLEPAAFTLEIQDDGKGPAGMGESRAQSRNGLRNMGKRMEDVGGRFAIGPAPEGGTLVRLTAPIVRR